MPYRQATPFQPIVLFTPNNDADRLAVAQVYSLQADVAETMNTERSQQQNIGISEIGGDCKKCVARKLSALYVKPSDPSWKAQVGTFIHAGLEEHFVSKYTDQPTATDEQPTYHMERRVSVLEYKGHSIGGSCDLFIEGASFGLVCDWKTQGAAKLKQTAAAKISSAYRVQMHTYGLGYELLGKKVTHVALYALPRDGELNDAKPVLMRYDRDIALEALARLQGMIDAAEIVGWERVIEAQDSASPCWDCRSYENLESDSFITDLTS